VTLLLIQWHNRILIEICDVQEIGNDDDVSSASTDDTAPWLDSNSVDSNDTDCIYSDVAEEVLFYTIHNKYFNFFCCCI